MDSAGSMQLPYVNDLFYRNLAESQPSCKSQHASYVAATRLYQLAQLVQQNANGI